jgi:hypothetical protein
MAPARHGGPRFDAACSHTGASTASSVLGPGVSDSGSVRRNGRRHLLQRRMAAARNADSGWSLDTHAAAPDADANARDTTASFIAPGLQDGGSIRCNGRRHLLQRWVAATGYAHSRLDVDTAGRDTAAVDTTAVFSRITGLYDVRPVRRDRWRHLLQRRVAATRHAAAIGRIDAIGSVVRDTARGGYEL